MSYEQYDKLLLEKELEINSLLKRIRELQDIIIDRNAKYRNLQERYGDLLDEMDSDSSSDDDQSDELTDDDKCRRRM